MRLGDLNFIVLMPAFMRDDPSVQGLAAGVDEIIQSAAPAVENLSTWGRIDYLPESELDALASEMNLLWYDRNASVDVRRQTVKDGYATWQTLGTKWAVENFIQTYFGEGRIEEWFEYGGEPGHFRIVTNTVITATQQTAFLPLLAHVKRASAKLDGFIVEEGV